MASLLDCEAAQCDIVVGMDNAIKSKLIEIESGGVRKRIVPALQEPSVTITRPQPPVTADMPTGKELQRLRDLCHNAYPALTGAYPPVYQGPDLAERDGFLFHFESAILALSHMNALAKPDFRHDAMHHLWAVKDVLMRIGRRNSDLQPPPLICACLVMGVPVSGPPGSASLGLAESLPSGSSSLPARPSRWP